METAVSIYDIPLTALDGTGRTLGEYRGRVLLIVNVASRCGFTPQYAGLEGLYRTYRDRGLVVLGFPCNQFLWQEPGGAADIGAFCSLKYNVTFPVFDKVRVNGPDAHPLYQHLTRARRGLLGSRRIKWNFTKFLVARDGTVAGRYSPLTAPEKLAQPIETLLNQPEQTSG
ncbi:MAG TPA: glutathione peroxidase [Urbifossiella sp.]|jgi:glutathione peroxidase|nr:glutathione peroxidase [Urbifossiella sp.]